MVVDTLVNTLAISFDFNNSNFITHDEHFLRIFGDTTITSIDNNIELERNKYLHQNFPNPCSESTNFRIYLPEDSNATLEIFDPNGKIVKIVFDCNLKKGNHNYTCNLHELSPGLYYNVLTINNNLIETNKIIVVK